MPKSTMMCCVVGCSNSYRNTEGKSIIFYSFPWRPYEIERREEWISNIRRTNEDGTPWQPTKNSRVCSENFIDKKKHEHPGHPDYVPTVFPVCYRKRKADCTERFQRLLKRSKLNIEEVCPLDAGEDLPQIENVEFPVADKRFEDKCIQILSKNLVGRLWALRPKLKTLLRIG
ncbi:peroxynitrite isomerase THAP4 isoform X2 [Nilaparvata lugens]|uniref:peroxynitrite isomerase THAP4 isoform X2 n=1 Tax=Nilaparvata lugens TaxID=108931 RepID=UPI00193E7166|nr:peroxynitrite isomerase THAP4 isoform X2 [Nilaparvata lugens]XP_039299306.1 peroxynitrite isomerase THAP4 isoform X2 [Nilaparvata lugens]